MKKNSHKIKLGIYGSSGRMGQEILKIASADKRFDVVQTPGRGKKIAADQKVDVWIDFSSPEGSEEILAHCLKSKAALVCGVTGLNPAQTKKVKKASESIPLFYARNMSIGVAILTESLKAFKNQSGFEYQIEEAHHNKKKDSPSGTALHLKENLDAIVGSSTPAPLAIRGGGIFGIHRVWAMAEGEYLTFEHVALNRSIFAQGSVEAANFMAGKKAGYYEMKHLVSK